MKMKHLPYRLHYNVLGTTRPNHKDYSVSVRKDSKKKKKNSKIKKERSKFI